MKFHKLQFAACLTVFAVVAVIGVHVPSPAVCGCSSANHQPQARISTSKTLRTSFHMMGSLKLQLWNIRFPLRSRSWSLMHESYFFKNTLVIVKLKLVIFFCRSWSLMHESYFFKNTLVIVKLKLVIFFCFCNGELLYLSDIVGLLHIKHD